MKLSLVHLSVHRGVALASLATVFVLLTPQQAKAQVFLSTGVSSTVGEYNQADGATISSDVLDGAGFGTAGLLVDGDSLLVTNTTGGYVSSVNLTTGTVTKNFISLLNPDALALDPTGTDLFVVQQNTLNGSSTPGQIAEYNASTGALINGSFITDTNKQLDDPMGIAVTANGNIFVSNFDGKNSITEFNSSGGLISNTFVKSLSSPIQIAASGNNLFAAVSGDGTIDEFDSAGNETTFVTGLIDPYALTVSGGDLYVTSQSNTGSGIVTEYDLTTGSQVGGVLLTSGMNNTPEGIAVVTQAAPEPSAWMLMLIAGGAFGWLRRRQQAGR